MTSSRTSASQQRPPRRKRVVLADRRGERRVPRAIIDLEDQSSMGEAMVRGLVRAQLRTSLLLAGVSVLVLGGLPLLLRWVPGLSEIRLWSIPLPWLVLGVLPFPFILLIGYIATREAERHEREFAELVQR
ncbi:hypothetical protein SAMN04487904_10682 [Actinopolyspora lacussalsi subsp. righensis]|uniref:Solute:sodium symporter small subunit n=1 Tax=Actinopolyspora righensis TaxID=995060 RepID=A0A1I7A754_9ACTN|nr:hypothetical protein [Actinopolyspora righensis]SFT70759.1 hypothetical protein SAMN04487904_10682 [Actinopolyspora righensis]